MFPYWENQPLSGAVDYLDSCYGKLSRAAGGKEIIVETGWPSAGDPKGAAVPSPANAAEYFTGFTRWAEAKKVRYYYFEAFDEPWKAGREGSVGAHWGIWESDGKLKASFRLGDRTTLLTGRRPA
ncbi:MAG: hypothetical protein FJ313_06795 [Gemmatimonadetes bacterium]|nr:hypothetical protein [Gemmatimonadota bacterium]